MVRFSFLQSGTGKHKSGRGSPGGITATLVLLTTARLDFCFLSAPVGSCIPPVCQHSSNSGLSIPVVSKPFRPSTDHLMCLDPQQTPMPFLIQLLPVMPGSIGWDVQGNPSSRPLHLRSEGAGTWADLRSEGTRTGPDLRTNGAYTWTDFRSEGAAFTANLSCKYCTCIGAAQRLKVHALWRI